MRPVMAVPAGCPTQASFAWVAISFASSPSALS
jgi:hypothetical protein